MLSIFTVMIVLLLVRLAWIQIIKGPWYENEAFKQQSIGRETIPKRGTIFDRDGKELAVSASVDMVTVNPQELKKSNIAPEQMAAELSKLLDLNQNDVLKKLTKSSSYEIIKRKIEKDLGNQIRNLILEEKITGLYVDEDIKRYYPDRNLAAQVIGFTGSDNQGLEGVEAVMDQYLKGIPGRILDEVDAGGRVVPFNEEKHIDGQDGCNATLTIDETIQYFSEKALQKAMDDYKVLKGGTVIVMDPRNGDILAMVSKPDFDLNNPYSLPDELKDIDTNDWNKLNSENKVKKLEETVWRNMAVDNTYEPGSTFKAITTAAALEEKAVSPESKVVCAPTPVSGWTINCWKEGGHGTETFREAVYNSCNPVFVKLAQSIGIDNFYKYVKGFGFYDKTGIGLPGETGSIMHKNPAEIDMATASFGQSFQITPIQLITAYAAIANGGNLLKPHIIKNITDPQGNIIKSFDTEVIRKVISSKTSGVLKDLLEGTVSQGTGINAYVKGYRVAGKTGTSQTAVNGVRSNERYIASFAAFAPADNPVICVLAVLDHPSKDSHSGGVVAGPVVRSIIEDSLNYLGEKPRYSAKDKEMILQNVNIPDLRNKSFEEAKNILSKLDIKVKSGGNFNSNAIVLDQTPKPGSILPEKSTIILYSNRNDTEFTVKMPDVLNKTIAEATGILEEAGLNIKVTGTGLAVKQEFASGEEVPAGKAVEVEFITNVPDD
jgi:stage V sporulation protein D (sporulation-specific penicillin-binding protein)